MKNLKKIVSLSAFLALIGSSTLWAVQEPIIIQSIRSMGMGGVQTTIMYDENCLYSNPANLSEIKKGSLKYLGLNVGASAYTLSSVSNFLSSVSAVSGNDYSSVSSLLGSQLDVRINPLTSPLLSYVDNGIGFGVFDAARFHLKITGNLPPNIEVNGVNDSLAVIGKSFHIIGPWTAGVSVKYLYRLSSWDLNDGDNILSVPVTSFNNAGYSSLMGSALGYDIGINTDISLPIGDAKLAIVQQNLGMNLNATVTTGNQSLALSEAIPAYGIIGLSFQADFRGMPMIGPMLGGKTTVAADYAAVGEFSTVFKRIHLGAEHQFSNGWIMRSGYNEGNWCAGLGIRMLFINVDYAYFVEELGSEIGLNRVANHIVALNIQF